MKKTIKYEKLIDIPDEFILNIGIKAQNALEYDEKADSCIIPEGEIKMYYWDKGYQPDIYYKMDFYFAGYCWETIGETVNGNTNMVEYLEKMRQDIIFEIFMDKFSEIIEKYKFIFENIMQKTKGGDFVEYSIDDVFETYNKLDKKSDIISVEDRKTIDFYQKFRQKINKEI